MKVEKKEVFIVGYSEIDRFFTEYYGHPYEYVEAEEGRNYSLEREVVKGAPIDNDWDQDKFDAFVNHGTLSYGLTGLLLEDLCLKGEIEPGEYFVDIFW